MPLATSLADVAPAACLVAIATLVGSGIALALFFGGAGQRWGPINDVLTAATLVLLAPAVLACWRIVDGWAVSWFGIASLTALVGIAIAAGGQLALVAGWIGLRSSFVTGGIGILPILAWAVALVAAGLTGDFPSAVTTALLTLSLVASAALAAAAAVRGPATALGVVSAGLLAALSLWLAALAVELSAYA